MIEWCHHQSIFHVIHVLLFEVRFKCVKMQDEQSSLEFLKLWLKHRIWPDFHGLLMIVSRAMLMAWLPLEISLSLPEHSFISFTGFIFIILTHDVSMSRYLENFLRRCNLQICTCISLVLTLGNTKYFRVWKKVDLVNVCFQILVVMVM